MKIVFAEPTGVKSDLLEEAKTLFESMGHEFSYFSDRKESEEELIYRIGNADIVTLSNIPVSANVIKACSQLKLINVAFTGVDHIDFTECRERGIAVCNAAGYSTVAVSEITVGLAVSLLRNIPVMDSQTRIPAGRNNYLGTELSGKTVGIVGTGAIGIAVAKLFSAFGCRILAYSRSQKDEPVFNYVSLNEVFEKSDIISLHIPSTADTKNIISREVMSLMKPTAVIINTARGQVIDNQALAYLLKAGKISGAAVDIYEKEPPLDPDHPLLSAPNTILLPHIAYATEEAMIKRFEIVKENIIAFIKGESRNRIL